MAEVSIDLSPVLRALNVVNGNVAEIQQHVSAVSAQLDDVAQEQAGTRQRLEELYEEFQDYIEKDVWNSEVSKAREELSLVRQQLEKGFGHYDRVRRYTTGILQAVDAAIVREDTIKTAAESVMLDCPRYWLAPALVAISAWISDNRVLAETAIKTATARDDSRASLFFSLVCRRAGRAASCGRWMERYLRLQNPLAMDREVSVMLDALANGVLGAAALALCAPAIDEWLAVVEEQAGFEEQQRQRWSDALAVLTPRVGPDEYPNLTRYSPTWPLLEAGLAGARRHKHVHAFFTSIFDGELVVPPALEDSVDDILMSLVTNFDDEELPLKRRERYCEIVIDVDATAGRPRDKRREVDRIFNVEQDALREQTSFAAVLTNAAMFGDQYGATQATKRYAVSVSRQWVKDGFNDLVSRDRASVPGEAVLTMGSWTGHSRDGSNEGELTAGLQQHYGGRILDAVNAVRISPGTWVAVVLGVLFGVFLASAALFLGLIVVVAVGAYLFFQHRHLEDARRKAREQLEKERDDAARVLKACLAELADFRRDIASEDAKAAGVLEFLDSLSSPQFVLSRPDQHRTIVA